MSAVRSIQQPSPADPVAARRALEEAHAAVEAAESACETLLDALMGAPMGSAAADTALDDLVRGYEDADRAQAAARVASDAYRAACQEARRS